MNVRAFFYAAKVAHASPPYDTIHLKIFYPAQIKERDKTKILGIVPANSQYSPFKIIILFNGINCAGELYQWLAVKLAEQGLVVVTFSWVAQNIPGIVGITPGVDIKMLAPNTYGTASTASALPTLLSALEQLQAEGVLAGLLDLEQIVLGGHSAGGRIAIENARSDFFPQVVAAFAYGAHTAGAVKLGYPPNTILPLPDTKPLLLIGGTGDGVIANSGPNYGVTWERPTTPIERTFIEAIMGGRNDSYLLLIEGANHFAITSPFDPTTNVYLDFQSTQPAEKLQNLIGEIVSLFIHAHVCSQATALKKLDRFLLSNHPLIASFKRK